MWCIVNIIYPVIESHVQSRTDYFIIRCKNMWLIVDNRSYRESHPVTCKLRSISCQIICSEFDC